MKKKFKYILVGTMLLFLLVSNHALAQTKEITFPTTLNDLFTNEEVKNKGLIKPKGTNL